MSNLDHDIREAARLGYGVHYGRYKADHPRTSPQPEAGAPTPVAQCKECGSVFVPIRSSHVYCSKHCQNRQLNREKYRAKKEQAAESNAREGSEC